MTNFRDEDRRIRIDPEARLEALETAHATATEVARDETAPAAARVAAARLLKEIATDAALTDDEGGAQPWELTADELKRSNRAEMGRLTSLLARMEAEDAHAAPAYNLFD